MVHIISRHWVAYRPFEASTDKSPLVPWQYAFLRGSKPQGLQGPWTSQQASIPKSKLQGKDLCLPPTPNPWLQLADWLAAVPYYLGRRTFVKPQENQHFCFPAFQWSKTAPRPFQAPGGRIDAFPYPASTPSVRFLAAVPCETNESSTCSPSGFSHSHRTLGC